MLAMLTISKVPYDLCEHTKSGERAFGDNKFKMAAKLSNLRKNDISAINIY